MLLQFKVSNYMSIKDEVCLDVRACSHLSERDGTIIAAKDENVLPAVAIFGPNAAGKSNINKAITAAILAVRNSTVMQKGWLIPNITPFFFDDESRVKPSEFCFVFVANNNKYEYGFSCDNNKFYSEYLYLYKSSWPSKIFERVNTHEYSFTMELESKMKTYIDKTIENKSFLATATAWGCKETEEACNWINTAIDTYAEGDYSGLALKTMEDNTADSYKDFVIDKLYKADINISDYNYNISEITKEEFNAMNPAFKIETIETDPKRQFIKSFNINMVHEVHEAGEVRRYELPLALESIGTQEVFFLSFVVKKALDEGRTLVVDELDKSFHSSLSKFIIELFNDNSINKSGAQLIFNTHDVSLLDLSLFRRDQICFVEKDAETGITDLYSLADFSVRSKENVRRSYLLGRYGAMPSIIEDGAVGE